MSFDLTDYHVGDEFEGSARELGKIISSILAAGGTFTYEGRSITITSLPNTSGAPVQAVTEAVVPEAPAPTAPDPKPVVPEAPAPKVPVTKAEVSDPVKPPVEKPKVFSSSNKTPAKPSPKPTTK